MLLGSSHTEPQEVALEGFIQRIFVRRGWETTEDPGDFRVEPSRLMKIYKLIEMCVITPQKANGSFTSEITLK